MFIKKLIIVICWPISLFLTLSLCLFLLFYSQKNNLEAYRKNEPHKEEIKGVEQTYHELGYILQNTISSINKENITLLIYSYLAKYHSPMKETATSLVETAYKYNLDPIFLVAIAQCESNLGKKQPVENCFNPFGLGITANGTLCFSSWEESYEKMAEIMKKNYVDKGLTTPEEIMNKYCPRSVKEAEGHWAKCVRRFVNDITNLKAKLNNL